jgi:hypothetical protein
MTAWNDINVINFQQQYLVVLCSSNNLMRVERKNEQVLLMFNFWWITLALIRDGANNEGFASSM